MSLCHTFKRLRDFGGAYGSNSMIKSVTLCINRSDIIAYRRKKLIIYIIEKKKKQKRGARAKNEKKLAYVITSHRSNDAYEHMRTQWAHILFDSLHFDQFCFSDFYLHVHLFLCHTVMHLILSFKLKSKYESLMGLSERAEESEKMRKRWSEWEKAN